MRRVRQGRVIVRSVSFIVLCSLCASWAAPAHAGLVTFTDESAFVASAGSSRFLDFDTDAGGNAISTGVTIDRQYGAWGIDFDGFAGGSPNTVGSFSALPAHSTPNHVRFVPDTGGGGGFELKLDDAVSGVGLWFGGVHDFTGSTVEAFDGTGQSLGSLDLYATIGSSPFDWLFLGVKSTAGGVAKLQVSIVGSDFLTVDDMTIGAQVNVVPLPRTLALGALGGLLVLGAARRRGTRRGVRSLT